MTKDELEAWNKAQKFIKKHNHRIYYLYNGRYNLRPHWAPCDPDNKLCDIEFRQDLYTWAILFEGNNIFQILEWLKAHKDIDIDPRKLNFVREGPKGHWNTGE